MSRERGARAGEQESIASDLSVRRIDGVNAWVVTHDEPISANSLVLVTRDGTPMLADTPWTPAATRDLLAWVERRFGRLPALATISHWHFDASGGIAALREAGVRVLASRDTARLLEARGESMQTQLAAEHGEAFVGWRPGTPDDTFEPTEERRERIGGTEIRVTFPGGAHSTDNVVTWFPESGLLFGGCLVKGGDDLGYLGDADLSSYPDAVDRLIALDPVVVVPGHGDRLDPEQLANTRALALAARDSLERAPISGVSADDGE